MKQAVVLIFIVALLMAGCSQAPTVKRAVFSKDASGEIAAPPTFDTNTVTVAPEIKAFVPRDFGVDNMVQAVNHEGHTNAILLLKEVTDSTAERTLMILQKSATNGSWVLLDSNQHLAGPEFTADGIKVFEDEELSMHGDTIQFLQHNYGPTGNREFLFVRLDGKWQLNSMETYNIGAGSQRVMNYVVGTGRVVVTIVNTMKEEMPEQKYPFSMGSGKRLDFSALYPDSLIADIFKKQEACAPDIW